MAMEISPDPDDVTSETSQPTRKRGTPKSLDERIEMLTQQAAALRQKRTEQQRKNAERLVNILGSALHVMMEQDAALRVTMATKILEHIARPADRELLHTWLASFSD